MAVACLMTPACRVQENDSTYVPVASLIGGFDGFSLAFSSIEWCLVCDCAVNAFSVPPRIIRIGEAELLLLLPAAAAAGYR